MDASAITLIPQLEPYRGLIAFLLEDLQGLANVSKASKESSEFVRRSTIKTIFTTIEGLVNLVKTFLLDNFSERYSHDEIMALKETQVHINEKGSINERDYFPRVQENLLFTFHMLQKGFDNPHEVDRKSFFWKRFVEFVEIRHKLTHPKVEKAVNVSERDIDDFQWTMIWMADNFVSTVCVALGQCTIEARVLKATWTILINVLLSIPDRPMVAAIKELKKENDPETKEFLANFEEGENEIAQAVQELNDCAIAFPDKASNIHNVLAHMMTLESATIMKPTMDA